jgi:hypothetical protein
MAFDILLHTINPSPIGFKYKFKNFKSHFLSLMVGVVACKNLKVPFPPLASSSEDRNGMIYYY